MPTFKIDGKEIPFEPDDTILRAALRAGIEIPYYCWHPALSVAPNCRMCLVEILPPPGRPALMLDVLELREEAQAYVTVRKPKLQPACQVAPAAGMEVLSDSSPHVRRARKAVQEFLLLNHPVDCPICDQAGECKLQDYWLDHQRTLKRMRDPMQHKPKAAVFGPHIVYDAERCIVCTRCVRFCQEVARDPVLSVRERGNLNEIVVSPGRSLDHPYSLMTEHVCPVGALTSQDFRFRARVWFLRSVPSVCQGCATGCNAWLDFDPRYQRVYRYRPRDNPEVNRYWMCDEGMLSYAAVHEGRRTQAVVNGKPSTLEAALSHAAASLREAASHEIAIVLSAQHSCEDNHALVSLARNARYPHLFLAARPPGVGDDILRNPDKNSNYAGAVHVAGDATPEPFDKLLTAISNGIVEHVIALGSYAGVALNDPAPALGRLKSLLVLGVSEGSLASAAHVFVPACSWAEAEGTYVNAAGIPQHSARAIEPIEDARPAWEIVGRLASKLGHPQLWRRACDVRNAMAPFPSSRPEPTDTSTDAQASADAVTAQT